MVNGGFDITIELGSRVGRTYSFLQVSFFFVKSKKHFHKVWAKTISKPIIIITNVHFLWVFVESHIFIPFLHCR